MNERVRVVAWKEWAELIQRKGLVATVVLLPFLFLVIALGLGLMLPAVQGAAITEEPDVQAAIALLRKREPGLAAYSSMALYQIFMFRQLVMLFLMIPVVCATAVAAHSIVGERVQRSLEPLLATPISTAELLAGKAIAAVLPGIGFAWATFAVYAVAITLFGEAGIFRYVFNATTWLLVLVLCPLISLLGLSVAIITSSRTSDPRSAQQISAVVILPIVGVVISQLVGFFFVTPLVVVAAAFIVAAIDFGVLWIGVRLFQRETILTRWK